MNHGQWNPRAPHDREWRSATTPSGTRVAAPAGARRPVRRGWRIFRRTLAAVVVLVLLAAGYVGYEFHELSSGMATSHALQGAPTSADGGTNILLMGLDTRKDQNGRQLPAQVLDQLHAGDGEEGGYNTNTLILLHVPADGGPVKAFSIPRDDAVTIPGHGKHKIKEAYGLAKAGAESTLARQGVTDPHELEVRSREAGRKATLDVVRQLTGVPVDHFAEVSLAGFYDLANALGGVEVCLNHPVQDAAYSGADFPAGRQVLNGAQALAFVRQRHGLPNGDLDRTHRQQAFLASASHEIRSAGTLFDVGRTQRLIAAAERDVVTDDGWSAYSLATQLQNMTGGNTDFQTLPIKGYEKVGGEDANLVDPAQIRALVQSTFAGNGPGAPAPAPASTVDVDDYSGRHGQVAEVADALEKQGFPIGATSTGSRRRTSEVAYGRGANGDAQKVAQALGGLTTAADTAVPAGHVKVILGRDFTLPAASAGSAPAPAGPPPGPQGPPVDAGGDGVPCVN